jgi:organic radical activating enzyme
MSYAVKEIFYTLQGEGARSGRAAAFCRFAGCNLWTGREEDREQAICQFCDTDFVGVDGPGGGHFAGAVELAEAICLTWGAAPVGHVFNVPEPPRMAGSATRDEAMEYRRVSRFVIRPLGDSATLKTCPTEPCSAEACPTIPYVVFTGGEPALQLDVALIEQLHGRGFEVAIETNGTRVLPAGIDWVCVSPKAGAPLRQRRGNELKLVYPQEGAPPDDFATLEFQHFFLQPMDGPNLRENMRRAVSYCLAHPQWRVSLQMHKMLGIP